MWTLCFNLASLLLDKKYAHKFSALNKELQKKRDFDIVTFPKYMNKIANQEFEKAKRASLEGLVLQGLHLDPDQRIGLKELAIGIKDLGYPIEC